MLVIMSVLDITATSITAKNHSYNSNSSWCWLLNTSRLDEVYQIRMVDGWIPKKGTPPWQYQSVYQPSSSSHPLPSNQPLDCVEDRFPSVPSPAVVVPFGVAKYVVFHVISCRFCSKSPFFCLHVSQNLCYVMIFDLQGQNKQFIRATTNWTRETDQKHQPPTSVAITCWSASLYRFWMRISSCSVATGFSTSWGGNLERPVIFASMPCRHN